MCASGSQGFFSSAEKSLPYVNPAQRPPALQAAINDEFAIIKQLKGDGYISTGDRASCYGFVFYGMHRLDSDMVLDKAVEQGKCLTVCDVGAGAFGFERHNLSRYGEKVINVGITATSFGTDSSTAHVIGQNAEYLSSVFTPEQFDFIFSRLTYIHLVDPVGAIIEAYKTLKPGGKLFIDSFYIRGCERYLSAILDHLKEQGYRVSGLCEKEYLYAEEVARMVNFIIQKTPEKPELVFPVSYGEIDRYYRVHYHPGSVLLQASPVAENLSLLYQKGMNIIEAKIQEKCKHADLILQCRQLPELFANPVFQTLDKLQKYLLILGLVAAMNKDYANIQARSEQEAQNNKLYDMAYFCQVKSFTFEIYYSQLCCLQYRDMFKQLSTQQQIMLLEHVAASNIIRFARADINQQELMQSGLSFSEIPIDRIFNDDDVLTFPMLAQHWQPAPEKQCPVSLRR